jgi:hypothetical protein
MDCHGELDLMPPLPDSAQRVYCILRDRAPITGQQLRETSGMPRRTIYTALQRLRDLDLLKEQVSLRDSRQTWFWIDEGHLPAAA